MILMVSTHSPLPFGEPILANESGVYNVRDANGHRTVYAYSAADAAFVRRACNSHEALLAALKRLRDLAVDCSQEADRSAWIAAHAAIALAETE